MENPVVVFVRADRCGLVGRTFPIAWNDKGERLEGPDAIKDKECCVILLDDDADVPRCEHANKIGERPLLIVLHHSSARYKKSTITNTNTPLGEWGKPIPWEVFLHEAGNVVFEEIQRLLANPGESRAFAEKRGIARVLDLLDQLGALYQTALISSGQVDGVRWEELVDSLPLDVSGAGLDGMVDDVEGMKNALASIAARANEWAGLLPD